MWSLGVILYILLSGLPPFWGKNEEEIFGMVGGLGGGQGKDGPGGRRHGRSVWRREPRPSSTQWGHPIKRLPPPRPPLLPHPLSTTQVALSAPPPPPPHPPQVLKGKVDFTTDPWPRISDNAKDVITKLLTMDPAKRPTAREILQVGRKEGGWRGQMGKGEKAGRGGGRRAAHHRPR
jgi:serine/threonine protein kinase